MTGLAGARPTLSVAGDRAIDEARVDLAHVVIGEAEPLHDAWPELLDQNVGAFDERAKARTLVVARKVERHALLAAIDQCERGRETVEARRIGAHVLAARPLDLDHL